MLVPFRRTPSPGDHRPAASRRQRPGDVVPWSACPTATNRGWGSVLDASSDECDLGGPGDAKACASLAERAAAPLTSILRAHRARLGLRRRLVPPSGDAAGRSSSATPVFQSQRALPRRSICCYGRADQDGETRRAPPSTRGGASVVRYARRLSCTCACWVSPGRQHHIDEAFHLLGGRGRGACRCAT